MLMVLRRQMRGVQSRHCDTGCEPRQRCLLMFIIFQKLQSVDPSSSFGAQLSATADMASASTHSGDVTRPPRIVTTVAEDVSLVKAWRLVKWITYIFILLVVRRAAFLGDSKSDTHYAYKEESVPCFPIAGIRIQCGFKHPTPSWYIETV